MKERSMNIGTSAEQFLMMKFKTPKDGIGLEDREVYEIDQKHLLLQIRL
jgi:hypothetical protein